MKRYLETKNESCDYVEYDLFLEYHDMDAIPFIVTEDLVYFGNKMDSHNDMIRTVNLGDEIYRGRLWLDSKVISFWETPGFSEIINILSDIENDYFKKFNEKLNLFDWYIDYVMYNKRNTLLYDYLIKQKYKKTLHKTVKQDDFLIPVKDFVKLNLSMNSKDSENIPYKYKSNINKKTPFELRTESCDGVFTDNMTLSFDDPDVVTFLYYNNKLYLDNSSTHIQIILKNNELFDNPLIDKFDYRNSVFFNMDMLDKKEDDEEQDGVKYIDPFNDDYGDNEYISRYSLAILYYKEHGNSGRLWKNSKVISFWNIPSSYNIFKTIINKISSTVKIDDTWRLDVLFSEYDVPEELEDLKLDNYYADMDDMLYYLVPFKYLNLIYDDIDKNLFDKKAFYNHLDPNHKNPVPYGFGSRNPKKKSLAYKQAIYGEHFITTFKDFVNESLYTDMLKSSGAELLDMYYTLGITPYKYIKDSITFVYDDKEFNKVIEKKGLKKSDLIDTKDYETFLKDDIKFFFLYEDILEPKYIIIEKDGINFYKLNKNISTFYDLLITKTVEFIDDCTYIYTTGNAGINWNLKNVEKANKIFKKELTKNELMELKKKYKYNII